MPVIVRFDPATYLPLTAAELQVLVALADGEKHGYAIGKEVTRRTDGQVTVRAATLYTVIKRLLADDLIEESDGRPDPALDDERRRYYRLSERGRKVAVAEANRSERTVAQARQKLKVARAAP
jgi:DNA-binding PadR family transcriptional regulator